MRSLVNMSLRFRLLFVIVAAAILGFGISDLRKMPVDVYPEFDPPMVEVQTEALGLSAAEVEAFITVPMEADLLNGVAWLDQIYSESVAGLSSILLIFEEGTDPIRARQMVQERLTQAHALPNVSKPPVMLQPLSTSSRAMMVGISSSELSMLELGVLVRWNIKPRLMGVPGVANVAVWGYRDRQLQVQVDPVLLHERGITLDQIIETAGEALWFSPLTFLESSKPGTGGWIDTPNQRLGIRHLLPISAPEDLAKVTVVGHEDTLLGDVTTIVEDHQPLIGDALLASGPAMMLVVEKFPGANTLEVTQGVEQVLAEMAPGLVGVQVDTTIFRPANYIESTRANLSTWLVWAAILLLIVFLAFLWDWRTTLVAVVAIPMSLIVATYVLYLRGATFNMMVLGGLAAALAILIHDVIIDVDSIARRLRESHEGADVPAAQRIVGAMLEMRVPVVFATLIILLALTPIFWLEGLSGAFLQSFVLSYALAILSSMVVALLLTPGLSLLLFSPFRAAPRVSPLVRGLQAGYNRVLRPTLSAPYAMLALALLVIIAGIATVPFLTPSLLPSLQHSHLLIQWEGAPAMSHSAMTRHLTRVMAELSTIPGVQNVGGDVGRAETGDQVVDINSGEIWVTLDAAAGYETTVAAIREVTDGYPGLFRDVDTYQPENLDEALEGTEEDVVVRIYGVDLEVLRAKAVEIVALLGGIEGVVDPRAEHYAEEPQVEIEVDLAAAERFGVKPGDVRRQATTLLSGIHVGSLFEEQKVFDVVVWAKPEIRKTLDDIRNLRIDTPVGGQIRLAEVADVRIAPTPIIIKRDAVSRYISVQANISGRNSDTVIGDIRAQLRQIEFPLEYRAEVSSRSSTQTGGRQRTILVVITAVIGIYLLLQAANRSWRLSFFVFVTSPMALAGGALAVFLNDGVLTLGSFFGFLTVLSLALRQAIVGVAHLQRLESQTDEAFSPDHVLLGAREWIGPTLLTTLAVALAFLPLLLFANAPGYEIVRPMAVVIIGGVVASTVFSLFVLPALYLRFKPEPETEMVVVSEAPVAGTA